MRKLFPFLSVLFFASCQEYKALNMEGAYSMKSQVMNDGSKDTTINRKQMKIYTDGYVIYAAMRFPDSLASYGIGNYRIEDGMVIEELFHTSANGPRRDTFHLKIEQSTNGYKQVISDLPSQGKLYRLTEEYEKVGSADSTPLDGAWKLVENYYVGKKGDTSSNPNLTEFKVYKSGEFIWAASYPDSSRRMLTFFGFGKFKMDGNNKSNEINALSTYPPLIDTTMHVQLEFQGNDSYKQTIVQRDSGRSVEIYHRLRAE